MIEPKNMTLQEIVDELRAIRSTVHNYLYKKKMKCAFPTSKSFMRYHHLRREWIFLVSKHTKVMMFAQKKESEGLF